MNIINSKETSEKILEELKQNAKGCIIRPSVAVIKIGENDKSSEFIKLQEDVCNKVGVYFRIYEFDESTTELTIINKIKELNNDDYVNGIMIPLPIPDKYNSKRLINTIQNSKDVDGMTDINVGRFISGRKTIVPSVALAVTTLLKENNIEIAEKNVVIVGRGKTAGRPLISSLINEDATVTVCHSRTDRLKNYVEKADILISAIGDYAIVTPDMIKDDSIVVDIGYMYDDEGNRIEDIDIDKIGKKSITFIPSSEIQKMRVTMLLKNVLLCYNNKK